MLLVVMGKILHFATVGSEIKQRKVGFIDFAEADGVGVEAVASFDFDVTASSTLLAKNSSPDCQQ